MIAMNSSVRSLSYLTALGLALLSASVFAEEDSASKPVDFSREILPVLSEKCFVCHGPDGTDKEILRLDSFEAATHDLGGYQAIDPEAPEKSELLTRIQSADDPMPPADAEKQLTAAQRQRLVRWIRQGGKYAKHWSFIPPKKSGPAWRCAGEQERHH